MKIALLYTGGTVGGVRRGSGPVSRSLKEGDFVRLLKLRLAQEGAECPPVVEGILGKLSENMTPEDWGALARRIDGLIREGVDGVVVAHGTDTLIYTGCALKWMLEGVPAPVVLTGSRIPLSEPGSDAPRNLAHALRVAKARSRKGVWISFSGKAGGASLVLDPAHAAKEAGGTDFFQPVLGLPAGRVTAAGRVLWRQAPARPVTYRPRLAVDSRVALFTVHPGFRPAMLEAAVRSGARGIVLAGYGSGTACVEEGPYDLREAVRRAAASGCRVWLVSQHRARVQRAYGSTAALVKAGARLRPDLTPEAAVTQLMIRPRE